MKLRVNPATGRIAERIPPGVETRDGLVWITYRWDPQWTVELLTDEQVADWPPVVLAPKPPGPDAVYPAACTCDDLLALPVDIAERDRWLAGHHDGHQAVPYAVKIHHPDNEPAGSFPLLPSGALATFHGSTVEAMAGLVPVTVADRADVTVDEQTVAGYIVDIGDGRRMPVPATALALDAASGG